MKFKILAILLMMTVVVCAEQKAHALLDIAKATIVVVDEDGKPIEGAMAGIVFDAAGTVGAGINIVSVDGFTDSDGRFIVQHNNDSDLITYGVEKEGYYFSNGRYKFLDKGTFGWKPWNPELVVVLRKIENPIPMYARKTDSLTIPLSGQKIGFDLIAFDWVAPYGKGIISDLIFNQVKTFNSKKNFSSKVIITFENEHDGILIYKGSASESELKLQKIAPITGYKSSFTIEVERKSGGPLLKSYDDMDNYIFRIRSKKDIDGNIKAMYGKIHGPIKIEPRTEPTTLMFQYYLNPDYTQNLEFDTQRNLFDNLPSMEQVVDP